jgi:uncharacterized repeat protein (TIGR03803 family)
MKQSLRLFAIVCALCTASCGRTALTPTQPSGTEFAIAKFNTIPQTIHVVPFYNYGKSGYEATGAPGGWGSFIGDETALYGTSALGGDAKCSTPLDKSSATGCGIVYRLVPKTGGRKYRLEVLHTFEGAPGDGAASFATLLADARGNLYGTTFYGGEYDAGTVFKLHPTSSGYTETIVHSFGYGQDGAYPIAGVVEVDGTLYGTTLGGGTYSDYLCTHFGSVPSGCGTVYRVNPATGAERVLHAFGKIGDGSSPDAALLDVGDTLYGTTDLGGTDNHCGTVFSIRKDGKDERVVHSFLNAEHGDGCNPFASLIAHNGTLYGTTCCGGGNFCAHCEGTLFSVDVSTGKEQVLHDFGQFYSSLTEDGSEPGGAVVDVHGVLYGTTELGGRASCAHYYGCGTIFSYAPSSSNATYNVLYQFKGSRDGGGPRDALLYAHGAFFGTTAYGGKKDLGTAVKVGP